jgi:hypothetical protein
MAPSSRHDTLSLSLVHVLSLRNTAIRLFVDSHYCHSQVLMLEGCTLDERPGARLFLFAIITNTITHYQNHQPLHLRNIINTNAHRQYHQHQRSPSISSTPTLTTNTINPCTRVPSSAVRFITFSSP